MTDVEIDQFCQKTLGPAVVRLAPLQAAVTQARFQFGIAVVAAPVTIAVLLAALAGTEALRPFLLAAVPFVVGGVIAILLATVWGLSRLWQRTVDAQWQYASAYKRDVVGALVAAFDPSWTYAPDTGYPYREYEKSDVALTPFDEYTSEDTITGVRDGKPFLCVELHTRVWRGRGKQRRLVTLFRGLFLRVTLGVHPDSRTVVLADSAEKIWGPYLGRIIEQWRLLPQPIVHLENPDFEREFVVHSSDVVAAHRLLSPRMMQQLADLRRRSGRTVSLALNGGVASLAMGMDRDLFEPGTGVQVPARLRDDAAAIVAALSFIATLVDQMPMPAPGPHVASHSAPSPAA